MVRFEWRDDLAVFDELEPWWNRQSGPKASPFLRAEWFRLWAECRLGPGERLRVLVGRDGASPVAAIPLLKRGPRLVALSTAESDSFDVICEDDPDARAAAASALAKSTYVRMDRLEGDSPLMENVARGAWMVRRSLDSPYIDTSDGMDPVLAEMGKKLRNNVRRAERHLESMGDLSMEPSTPAEFLAGVFEESVALEARGWKGQMGGAMASSEPTRMFYRRLAEFALDRDWLKLGVLRLDGRIIAFNFDIEYGNRLFGLVTSYDEDLDSKCSPGNVLLLKTLECCVKRGNETYELGGGSNASWKLRWTSATRRRYDVIGYGGNLSGRFVRLASSARSNLKRGVR